MKRFSALIAAFLTAVATASAQDPICYPMILDCNPIAARIGHTSTVVVNSRYDQSGAFQVIVSGTGVRGSVVPAKEPKLPLLKLEIEFTVAADALPGVRDFRVATPRGVSTLGQLVLVPDPIVVEKAANDTLAKAMPVDLPAAVCGAIEKAEDVDFYKFHVTRGTSLVFHVRAARCQDRIHDLQSHVDPLIALRNAQGTVLAMSDNYFFADPLLCHRFTEDGDYYLEIRDVRYQGNAYWQYVVEINDRPLVTNVFPLAVSPETPTRLELVGYNLPAEPIATATAPLDVPEGPAWIALALPAVDPKQPPTSAAAPIVITRLPLCAAAADNHSPATAQAIESPSGVNGRLTAAGALDYYSFEAKKGQRFAVEVMARRHQSALDPVLTILNEKGARLTENDDLTRHRMTYRDSLIESWTVPADGRYTIEVRDLHWRGGPEYVYFLSLTASDPSCTLEIDGDKAVVPRGGAAALFVRAMRKNGLNGEIQLAVDGLPAGVKATAGRILPGEKDGCIVFEADRDATLIAANVRVTGSAVAAEGAAPLFFEALPWQETYAPGGGRILYPVEMCSVSIAEPLDLTAVKVQPTEITLAPGGSQTIEVSVERAEGFKKNVSLDCMFRHLNTVYGSSLPPGVTIDEKKSKLLLTGGQTTGSVVLTAAQDAPPVQRQVVPLQAHVSINFVMKMSYASAPLFITVTEK